MIALIAVVTNADEMTIGIALARFAPTSNEEYETVLISVIDAMIAPADICDSREVIGEVFAAESRAPSLASLGRAVMGLYGRRRSASNGGANTARSSASRSSARSCTSSPVSSSAKRRSDLSIALRMSAAVPRLARALSAQTQVVQDPGKFLAEVLITTRARRRDARVMRGLGKAR